MNKLLQHIIDAGDVDHKILPGLKKMQKGGWKAPAATLTPSYTPVKTSISTNVKSGSKANTANVYTPDQIKQIEEATELQNARDRQGYISQAEPAQSTGSKVWNVLTHPMTALQYKMPYWSTGRKAPDLPEHFERGPRNSLELASDIVNPFFYMNEGKEFVKGSGNILNKAVTDPGSLNAMDFVNTGMHALGSVPLVAEGVQGANFLRPAIRSFNTAYKGTAGMASKTGRFRNALNAGALDLGYIDGDITGHSYFNLHPDQVGKDMYQELSSLPKGAFTTDPSMSTNSAPLFWTQLSKNANKKSPYTIVNPGKTQELNWSGNLGRRLSSSLPEGIEKIMPDAATYADDLNRRIDYLKNLGDPQSLAKVARLEKEGISSQIITEIPDAAKTDENIKSAFTQFLNNYKPHLDNPIIGVNEKTGLDFPLTNILDYNIGKSRSLFYQQPSAYLVKGDPLFDRVPKLTGNYIKKRTNNFYFGNEFQNPRLPLIQANTLYNLSKDMYDSKQNQYEMGGQSEQELPKAQWGQFINPVNMGMMAAKVMDFFGLNKPNIVRTPASAPKRLSIRDPRKVMMTTGKPLRPNSDLVSGDYDSEELGNLLTEAKRRNMSYNDMMNLAAMGFQETKWGKSDDNIGHTQGNFGPELDSYSSFINAYNAKMKDADRLNIKDEATRLQVYNGLGKIFPSTEAGYHGFNMKKIYGVPVPKGGIDLRKNPLYGKQVMDIRDNVLKRNPEFMRYMDSTYRAPMPEEQKYGGENNMFKVFAQEGVEYKGPSVVDYLATKGYAGKKEFRKELANKYGIEDYDFSGAKNTELLNKLRESDELLRQYDQTMTPISVDKIREMEEQVRAVRESANERRVNSTPVYNYSPEFQNMKIPQTKVNTSLQPKAVYDKFSLKPKMVIPMPFGFNKTSPMSEVSNSEITSPITPVKSRTSIPQFNPFTRPAVKPELGPYTTDRYTDVAEVDPVNQELGPKFMFTNENILNFNKNKQKTLLPVVLPANKPAVKTEKYTTESEAEEIPWYEKAVNSVSNALTDFYDGYVEAVRKSPLDFSKMSTSPAGFSPEGVDQVVQDVTKGALGLFSTDMSEKYTNWLKRQKAIKNMDKDPVSKIVVPDFDYAPMYITGDTIPDGNRQYHLPESMDLNALRFGSRNRGDLTPIDTEAGSITAFHPFVDSKSYFTETPNDPVNSTYLGITPDGQIQVGGRKDFENKDVKISRVFSNNVVDFVRDQSGSVKKVPAGAKVNKNAFSPAVTVLDEQGKKVEGKLNLVVPQGNNADEAFGVATGGRFIFKTPDGQTRLVSGSLKNIEEEFKRIKGKNPYVTVVSLDNGSYSRGLRTKDKKLTAADLRSYDNLNHGGGGNFAYLLPGQQTSRPLAKFAQFEQEATKKLQSLYPGKKVSVGYQNTGLYDQSGGRDIQSQIAIQKQGNSQTPVSLHNFGAAKDYVLYVDGKAIDANKDKKIYKDVLWNTADKVGMYHLEEWDPAHISLAKEGQKTAFDELKSKYPEIFTDPNFVKSLEFINKNKNNPSYQEYYELLNNIQPFTGAPRTTEFMKKSSSTKKAYGGPILDSRGQWAHPGKVTRIPSPNITMQGVPYPVYGVGSNGQQQMMYPGQEYNFGGASYVDEYPMMANGGYTVTRSNDRKGKTHKVTGPGGVVKYFGDSKLGQHPKDPERKAAFYARHKKNLDGNPFFRAFARKTWEDGGTIPQYQMAGSVSKTDSVRHQAGKILKYEQLRGGPGGSPLSYYSDPSYMNMLMGDIYPQVKKILPNASAMEASEAMDFIFNAGWDKAGKKITKDPRAYALQEYYRQYNPSKLDAQGNWSGRKNPAYSFDEEYKSTIGKLPENKRRVLMNKGRDWYYRNINNPAPGVPNSNYYDTWYGRIWNTNDYLPFNPNNPNFKPKKEMGGVTSGKQPLEKKHGIKVTYKK